MSDKYSPEAVDLLLKADKRLNRWGPRLRESKAEDLGISTERDRMGVEPGYRSMPFHQYKNMSEYQALEYQIQQARRLREMK